MNVFVVTQLSVVGGQQLVNVTVCSDLHSAKSIMDEEIRTLLSDCPKYKGLNLDEIEAAQYDDDVDCDYYLERSETSFLIGCAYDDDYLERIEIEEKPLVTIL